MHNWDKICDESGPLVWATVYRVLNDYAQALDCYQDVFLEAFERTQNRAVEGWPSLLRWLAVRRAIDRLRQRRRHDAMFAASAEMSSALATTEGPVEAAQRNELMERVCEELAKLPEKQSQVFWMRCVEQMSYAEIAGQIGTDTNAVGVLIHRAKLRLRKMLADLNPSHVPE